MLLGKGIPYLLIASREEKITIKDAPNLMQIAEDSFWYQLCSYDEEVRSGYNEIIEELKNEKKISSLLGENYWSYEIYNSCESIYNDLLQAIVTLGFQEKNDQLLQFLRLGSDQSNEIDMSKSSIDSILENDNLDESKEQLYANLLMHFLRSWLLAQKLICIKAFVTELENATKTDNEFNIFANLNHQPIYILKKLVTTIYYGDEYMRCLDYIISYTKHVPAKFCSWTICDPFKTDTEARGHGMCLLKRWMVICIDLQNVKLQQDDKHEDYDSKLANYSIVAKKEWDRFKHRAEGDKGTCIQFITDEKKNADMEGPNNFAGVSSHQCSDIKLLGSGGMETREQKKE